MRAAPKNFFTVERLAVLLFGLTLLLFPLSAAAVAQRPDEAEEEPQQQATPRRTAPGVNLMERLNLSHEQRQQLREIRRQSEAELRAHTRRVRLARRALDEAIYADSSDEAKIEHHARLLLDAQAELLRLRVATELQVRRVLTPAQLQAFRELRRQAQRRQRLQLRGRGRVQPRPPAEDENN